MDIFKIANLIKSKRKELGLTQKTLAEKLNVTEKAISKWETARGMPDISLLIPLSKILNVSVLELLNGEEVKDENEVIVNMVKKNYQQVKFWKFFSLIIINLLLVLFILIVIYDYMLPSKYEKNNHQSLLKITSDSMYPLLKSGDNIVYDKEDITKVKEGDIIIYYYTYDDNKIDKNYQVVHRVIKVINNHNEVNLKTRGDFNYEDDKYIVNKDNYLGIYNHKLPIINKIFSGNDFKISKTMLIFILLGIISIITFDISQIKVFSLKRS